MEALPANEVRILGPLEVLLHGRNVALGGAKQRLVMATLAVYANQVVSTDRLIDVVWGGTPPAGATHTIQKYVHRVRGLLTDAACAGSAPVRVETRAPGYVLFLDEGVLDAEIFVRLVEDAGRVALGNHLDAVALFDRALQLWRGGPWQEFVDVDLFRSSAARLETIRVTAIEDRADHVMALGLHRDLISPLEQVIAENPFRERPRAQLMLALHRDGRQVEALRAFQSFRSHLADEVGLEPSAELQQLEDDIIMRKPHLDLPPTDVAVPSSAARDEHLPTGVITFLLTDIVESTRLWDESPSTMAVALATHDAIIADSVSRCGGVLLKTKGEGDSTFSVFARATDALVAAVSAQRALLEEHWPDGASVSVRIALHTGEAYEHDGDYFGPTVNRTARIRGVVPGGLVFTSQSTRDLVVDALPDDTTIAELGPYALTGLARTERIYCVQTRGFEDWRVPVASTEVSSPGASPLPAVLRRSSAEMFIGRSAELDVLQRDWKDAEKGERRTVLIGGEPGVGKTRLVAQLADRASADGAIVLYGRCDDDVGIPYRPWVEALRHLVLHQDRDVLVDHLAHHGDAIGVLVPEVLDRAAGRSTRSLSYLETERYRLFRGVERLLARTSRDRPILVILEDLHWADASSLLLLRHVIGSDDRHNVLLLGTYRASEVAANQPLSETLAALHRGHDVRRIALPGLTDDDVVDFVASAAGHTIDDDTTAFAHALHRETDGNPFFVGEVLRHLAETGTIVQTDDGHWIADVDFREHGSLPVSVREVIGQRVGHLGAETEQLLRTASVIGRGFDLDVLARATDDDSDHVLDLLDEAVRSDLVREEPGRPGWLSFSHALIEHALYDDLGSTRQQRLHRRVANALTDLYSAEPGDRIGELAYHWIRASRPGDSGTAIELAMQAGAHAVLKLAPDAAVNWYQQALDLADVQQPADDVIRCQVLVALGSAQTWAGDPRFRDTLLRAAALARQLDDPALLVSAVFADNRYSPTKAGDTNPEWVASIEAALAAIGAGESSERAKLLAMLAGELSWTQRPRAIGLIDEALAVARRVGDDQTLFEVLAIRPEVIWSPATLDERIANASEQREIAERIGDPKWIAGNACNLTDAAVGAGDFSFVEEESRLLAGIEDVIVHPVLRVRQQLQESWRALLAGDLAEAERCANDALAVGVASGYSDIWMFFAAQMFEIRRAQGRLGEIIDQIQSSVDENTGLPITQALLALALVETDRVDEASTVFEPLFMDGFTGFPFDMLWLSALTSCADVAAALEHEAGASVLAELLMPWRDQFAYSIVACHGSVRRPLGVALSTAGHHDEAVEMLEHAAALYEHIPAPIELARTRVDWAHALSRRAQPGDAERANALAIAASKTATELELGTVIRQAARILTAE